ncbi:MAG: hypothetical protein V3S02_02320 [Dehalococcoidales bacterium]
MKKKPLRHLTGGIIASLVAAGILILSGCSAAETVGGAETGSGNTLTASRTVTMHQSRY